MRICVVAEEMNRKEYCIDGKFYFALDKQICRHEEAYGEPSNITKGSPGPLKEKQQHGVKILLKIISAVPPSLALACFLWLGYIYNKSGTNLVATPFLLTAATRTQTSIQRDHEDQKDQIIKFEDMHLLEFLGSGVNKVVFKATIEPSSLRQQVYDQRIYNATSTKKLYAVKISGNSELSWMHDEVKLLQILNAKPTIPNIPEIETLIPSIINPLTNQTYLQVDLNMDMKHAARLVKEPNISVLVMEYLDIQEVNRKPVANDEIRIFMRSLLKTLEFAHSRDVMNRDVCLSNIFFDGSEVKLFDWDKGAIYQPNEVLLRPSSTKVPPEGWKNESAVHTDVSGYDVWSVGLTLKKILSRRQKQLSNSTVDGIINSTSCSSVLLEDFLNQTMIVDPYQRPNASVLLQHPFLVEW